MSARSEILRAARHLAATSPDGTFSTEEIVKHLTAEGTRYPESTIRTHVISSMCSNAPVNHATTYNDLERVARGRYRLRGQPAADEPQVTPRRQAMRRAVDALLTVATSAPQQAFDTVRRMTAPAASATHSDIGVVEQPHEDRLLDALPAIMSALAESRPVFHSEADFQHALAWEIHVRYPTARVRLETKPVRRVHLRILVENDGEITAIELKYLTREWQGTVDGESFNLASHGAQDIRGYDCVKDVTRVETLVSSTERSSGLVIVLTNDSYYWRIPTPGRVTNADAFRLHEGSVISGERLWGPMTGGTRTKREDGLRVAGHYDCHWLDYSTIPGRNGEFRYLAVPISATDVSAATVPPEDVPPRSAKPASTMPTTRTEPMPDTRTAGAHVLRKWLEAEGWSVSEGTDGRRQVFAAGRNGVRRVVRYTTRSSGDFQLSTANNHTPLNRDDHYWAFVDLGTQPSITVVLEDDARAFFKTEHENYLANHGGHRPRNDKSEHQGMTDSQLSRLLDTARTW